MTSHDINPERVRELLKARTPGEWKVYKYWNGRLDVHSPTGEDDTCTSVITYPTAVDAELLALAPKLAESYLDSQEQLEALTQERDRLAHELRLLREAVGQPVAVEVSEHRRKNAEAVRSVLTSEWQTTRRIWLVCGLNYGTALVALHDAVTLGWAERQKPAVKATKAYFRLASLSDDTPERSGACAVCQGTRLVLVDDDCEVPCPHCTEAPR